MSKLWKSWEELAMSLYKDSSCSSCSSCKSRHFGVVQDASEWCYECWPGCQTSWHRGTKKCTEQATASRLHSLADRRTFQLVKNRQDWNQSQEVGVCLTLEGGIHLKKKRWLGSGAISKAISKQNQAGLDPIVNTSDAEPCHKATRRWWHAIVTHEPIKCQYQDSSAKRSTWPGTESV